MRHRALAQRLLEDGDLTGIKVCMTAGMFPAEEKERLLSMAVQKGRTDWSFAFAGKGEFVLSGGEKRAAGLSGHAPCGNLFRWQSGRNNTEPTAVVHSCSDPPGPEF